MYANGGGFLSKSKFKDYFATERIASPKVQVGQPKGWESLPFWQTFKECWNHLNMSNFTSEHHLPTKQSIFGTSITFSSKISTQD